MSDLALSTVALPPRTSEAASGQDEVPFLRRLRGYLDLNRSDLQAFEALLDPELRIKKRRDVVCDGYEFKKLCFVKEGYAARYKVLRNGKRQIVTFVLPGDIIGMPVSFFDYAPYSVVAITDMVLQVCTLEAFIGLSHRRPKFALALSWFAVHEAANHAEHIINIGRRTPIERVAFFLLEIHARLANVGCANETGFKLDITQEMMSDALGLSVPHLNRMLSRLRADDMIAICDRHVEFVNLRAIRALAQFQPIKPSRVPTLNSANP